MPKKKQKKETAELSEEFWEVEKIVDMKRDTSGRKLYKLRWKGYSANDDTWQREDDLDCKALIDEFYAERKQKEDTRKRKKKERKSDSDEDSDDFSDDNSNNNHRSSSNVILDSDEENNQPLKKARKDKGTPKKRASDTGPASPSQSDDYDDSNSHVKEEEPEIGWKYGHKATGINTVKRSQSSRLIFQVIWEGQEQMTWVDKDVVYANIPLMALDFYEGHLAFKKSTKEGSSASTPTNHDNN